MNQIAWTYTVRLTHWLVAGGVILNMFNDTDYIHRQIGYACLLMVLVRICYGLFWSKAESSHINMPTLVAIKQHLHEMRTGKLSAHYGHNPLGQLAVFAMWSLIGLLAFTGWLSRTDTYWGEDWPVDLHQYLSDALMYLVFLHIIAIGLMSKLQKRNLVKQMLTGKRDGS
ncbi:MAG: cytochrome b/b6 domain-containing protein [Methylophilaceae bacterium]